MSYPKEELKRLLELHDSRFLAIPRREIKRILGYQNGRKLRLIIHELRTEGLPVMFSTDNPMGYWLPGNRAELDEGLRKWVSYLKELGKDYRMTRLAGERWLLPATQRNLL